MSEMNGQRGASFPFRYLGLAFFLAWNWCLNSRESLVWNHAISEAVSPPSTVLIVGSSLACITTLVAIACLCRHVEHVPQNKPLVITASIASVFAAASRIAIANDVVVGLVWELACVACMGFATAVFTLCWADVYTRLGSRTVFIFGAGSLLLCGTMSLFLSWVMQPVRSIFAVVFPLISIALCALSVRNLPIEQAELSIRVRYSFPWKPVVVMGFAGFIAEFVTVTLFTQGTMPPIIAEVLVGILVLMVFFFPKAHFSPNALMLASMASLVAAMALLAFGGSNVAFTVAVLAMSSYVGIRFFTYSLLASLGHRYAIPSAWLFGFAAAASEFTSHAIGFVDLAFPQVSSLVDNHLQLAIFSVVGLVGFVVIGAIWLSEKSFKGNWAVDAIDVRTGEKILSEHELFELHCEQLGAEHGLSEREIEIMMLLAEKRPYQDIAQDLVLSLNTVKSHAHHVYTKLGLHTREELLAAIEAH